MNASSSDKSASGPAAPAESEPTLILSIEDDPGSAALVVAMLEGEGEVHVVVARDGNTGLEIARKRKPSLVILDLRLPDISGEEVLAELRADPETESIPVIVVTVKRASRPSTLPTHDAYLQKPIDDVADFIGVVRKSLARKR